MSVAPEPVNPEHDPMTIDPSNLGSVDPLSVEGIFLMALGKPGDERAAFLAEQCGDDDRRQRVEALLAAYESAGSFLEKPAIAIEPTPVGQYLAPCEVPGAIGMLGPYEILEEIGRGGMGVVFRAHDPLLQRIVAVKALAPELARLPTARQRFLREARAAAAISHPHVVTIFAVDGTEQTSLGTERTTLPYLVMECIVGQTLHDKIKRVGALKVEEIVRISRQIAEGLGAAHKRGLIHRDIKPANILLENGVERVKITDFGLARTVSDGGITHTGEILGTPQCMSPEQARGEVVDQRSDLFSLGCVMYTMCTGVSPFRADNMLAVMKKVCEATPRPIAELNPAIPAWLGSLVHQLLEKQAEQRPQTAEDVVEVLESQAIGQSPHSASAQRRLLTSVRPRWYKTPAWLNLEACVLSLVLGVMHGAMPGTVILESLAIGGAFWMIALQVRVFAGAALWATWTTIGISMASLATGSLIGAVLRHEAGPQVQGILFVFGLAVGIFWLLTRWFPQLFLQNAPLVARSHESAPVSMHRPRAHWSNAVLLVTIFLAGGVALLSNFLPSFGSPTTLREMAMLIFAATASLWIFVRLVAWGMSHSQPQAAARPATFPLTATQTPTNVQPTTRSPWSILGWILVTILGVGLLGVGLFVIALIVPWIAMSNAPKPVVPHSGPHPAHVTIRSSLGERIIGVNVDGSPAFLTSLGEGMCQLKIEPGLRAIVVAFESPDPKNYERIYSTQVNVSNYQAVEIEAVPVNQARMAPKKDISSEIEGRFEAALAMENDTSRHNTLVRLAEDAANAGYGELVLNVIAEVDAGTARNNTCAICVEALLKHGMTSAATVVALQMDNNSARHNTLAKIASAAIPAVDSPAAVSTPNPQLNSVTMPEPSAVLVEPTPIPDAGIDRNSAAPSPSIPLADAVEVLTDPQTMPIYPYIVGSTDAGELKTQVWIDEPGLIVRLKPLDFEGQEKTVVELVSNPAWGVGWFTSREGNSPWMEIPPGRYRVLVQDPDYGWSLDRRGTIVIGRGKQTIHVKRSFAGQQMAPAEYPVPFRWAGKSYQLTTADQVSTVNRYLAQLAGETFKPILGASAKEMFVTHPLSEQLAMVTPPGEWTLKYSRPLLKLELPDDPVQESITFDHPQGVISWRRSVPEGFHIPQGDLKYDVSYKPGFGWPGEDSRSLDISQLTDQRLVISRLTKAMVREAVNREYDYSQVQLSSMNWFREQSTTLPTTAVPAAKRLILAWLDGQPDVPESELLTLGKAESFELLWKVGVPADQLMPAFLVPGSTPGTWRIKEPPEGAVVKD